MKTKIKIPTIDEFLNDGVPRTTKESHIEFAKIYVTEALRIAAIRAKSRRSENPMDNSTEIDSDSIRKSYSLKNIK